jgi:hypothetical protein
MLLSVASDAVAAVACEYTNWRMRVEKKENYLMVPLFSKCSTLFSLFIVIFMLLPYEPGFALKHGNMQSSYI